MEWEGSGREVGLEGGKGKEASLVGGSGREVGLEGGKGKEASLVGGSGREVGLEGGRERREKEIHIYMRVDHLQCIYVSV